MTRPDLPDSQRRVQISVTLSPRAVAILDRIIARGDAATRSRAAELAILFVPIELPRKAKR